MCTLQGGKNVCLNRVHLNKTLLYMQFRIAWYTEKVCEAIVNQHHLNVFWPESCSFQSIFVCIRTNKFAQCPLKWSSVNLLRKAWRYNFICNLEMFTSQNPWQLCYQIKFGTFVSSVSKSSGGNGSVCFLDFQNKLKIPSWCTAGEQSHRMLSAKAVKCGHTSLQSRFSATRWSLGPSHSIALVGCKTVNHSLNTCKVFVVVACCP